MATTKDLSLYIDAAIRLENVEKKIPILESILQEKLHIEPWPLSRSLVDTKIELLIALGDAYLDRVGGAHVENIDSAIGAFEAALDLMAIETQASARVHANLSAAYQGRRNGKRSDNIELAIQHAIAALSVYTRQDTPGEWALSKNNLGASYEERVCGLPAENLELALDAYTAALAIQPPLIAPNLWATVLQNLGNIYQRRMRGSRSDNLERALNFYSQALLIFTRNEYPIKWAQCQDSLALVYQERIEGDPPTNTESAIESSDAALTVYTREAFPLEWAKAVANRGIGFAKRARGNPADNIERAIKSFEAALTVISQNQTPREWAALQGNLGKAYDARVRGNRGANFESAIGAFERALSVYTPEDFPNEYAQTNLSLGIALEKGAWGENVHHREWAIGAFQAALTILNLESSPREWAAAQNSLGIAYARRVVGDPHNNLKEAIIAFESTLLVNDFQTSPMEFANVQHNLGLAYLQRSSGECSSDNDAAVKAFEAAIRVRILDVDPVGHFDSCRALTEAHVASKNWPAALKAYERGEKAFILLLDEGVDHDLVGRLLSRTQLFFAEGAYAAVELKEYKRALEILNRGRAHLLALGVRERAPTVAANVRERLDNLRQEIRTLSKQVETATLDDAELIFPRLHELRQNLVTCISTECNNTRFFEANPPNIDADAIIAPFFTKFGAKAVILIIENGISHYSAIDLPDLIPTFARILNKNDNPMFSKWQEAYFCNYHMRRIGEGIKAKQRGSAEYNALLSAYKTNYVTWIEALDSLGAALWNALCNPLSKEFERRRVPLGARIIWMPPGALANFPIGIARNPRTRAWFGSDYQIVCAPSLEALAPAPNTAPPSICVVNPDSALMSSQFELSAVANHFDETKRSILVDAEASLDRVLAALQISTYWHFVSHASFNWFDPNLSSIHLANSEFINLEMLKSISRMNPSRLVVLSACEIGSQDIHRNADEFFGFPAMLIRLGAEGVISALWPVDDVATALLMSRFYELHVGSKIPPSKALMDAQGWLREATYRQLLEYVDAAATQLQEIDAIKNLKLAIANLIILNNALRLSSSGSHRTSHFSLLQFWSVMHRLLRKSRSTNTNQPFSHPYYWGGFIYTGR